MYYWQVSELPRECVNGQFSLGHAPGLLNCLNYPMTPNHKATIQLIFFPSLDIINSPYNHYRVN